MDQATELEVTGSRVGTGMVQVKVPFPAPDCILAFPRACGSGNGQEFASSLEVLLWPIW